MNSFYQLADWIAQRNRFDANQRISFVPTMGNLHRGHASLIKRSLQECDQTVVSLFVNPAQFNQSKDFELYPRTIEQDIDLLESMGVTYCLIPTDQEIYADGYNYSIGEQTLNQLMEGASRPGHFNGVLTVMMKLLNLVRPTHLYMGEKDYQQCLIIRKMIESFFMPITFEICPTVRESSGLACSSRNSLLNSEQLAKAHVFAQIFHSNQPLAAIHDGLVKQNIVIDYLMDYDNRRFVAVKIGDVRLIDNKAL